MDLATFLVAVVPAFLIVGYIYKKDKKEHEPIKLLIKLFFLGVLCNILIYIGVEGYRSNPHELGKYLSLFFGVMIFILCGAEHCVADMFFFWAAGAWSGRAVLCILVITAGNFCGGLLFPLLRRMTR